MKKTAALLLALLLLFLTACGVTAKPTQPTTPAQPAPVTEDNPPDPAEPAQEPVVQADPMELFAAAAELWRNVAENDRTALTITDLDHNGRQELIVSQMGGSGFYSYTRFFEINESGDGVKECLFDIPEGTSQPDLLSQDTADCWYDQQMDEYIYIFKDYLPLGAAESFESIRGICLKNGTVKDMVFANKHTSGNTVTYTDEFGNPFESSIYEIAAEMAFWGFDRTEAKFNWVDLSAFDGLTGAELAAKLTEAVS